MSDETCLGVVWQNLLGWVAKFLGGAEMTKHIWGLGGKIVWGCGSKIVWGGVAKKFGRWGRKKFGVGCKLIWGSVPKHFGGGVAITFWDGGVVFFFFVAPPPFFFYLPLLPAPPPQQYIPGPVSTFYARPFYTCKRHHVQWHRDKVLNVLKNAVSAFSMQLGVVIIFEVRCTAKSR